MKNKQEPVYKTPVFLSRNLGIARISESGIFEGDHCFTKIYSMEDMAEGLAERMREQIRTQGTEWEMAQGGYLGGRYLLIRKEAADMQEAMEKFSEIERELGVQGFSAEQRLEKYCGYMSELLGKAYRADSYLLETPVWKEAAVIGNLKSMEGVIAAGEKHFAVMAVRRFPGKLQEGILKELEGESYVAASYLSVWTAADERVREEMEEEYLGVDGILPRMKRKAPLLYHILKAEEGSPEDTGSFMGMGAYFLLYAETDEELRRNISDFSKKSGESGIWMEKVPLAELKKAKETTETFAMFGLMGCSRKRYGNFLPAEEAVKLFLAEQPRAEAEDLGYDVEEMRTLFFGGDLKGGA